MSRFFRRYRRDIAVIVGILLVAAAAWGVMALCAAGGNTAVVRVNGAEWARYPLSKDGEYAVETVYGRNLVTVKDGRVSVTDADCPDKICVATRAASRVGETILCLPHRLSVTVEGSGDPVVDIG